MATTSLANDGYVRLTFARFLDLRFKHLVSGLDAERPGTLREGAGFSPISGYTEWICDVSPAITIGWDWCLDVSQSGQRCSRENFPRSNVMFLDNLQRDIGAADTEMLLAAAIDEMDWQRETLRAIGERYA